MLLFLSPPSPSPPPPPPPSSLFSLFSFFPPTSLPLLPFFPPTSLSFPPPSQRDYDKAELECQRYRTLYDNAKQEVGGVAESWETTVSIILSSSSLCTSLLHTPPSYTHLPPTLPPLLPPPHISLPSSTSSFTPSFTPSHTPSHALLHSLPSPPHIAFSRDYKVLRAVKECREGAQGSGGKGLCASGCLCY